MTATVPMFIQQSLSFITAQGCQIEINCPALDANTNPVDMTSGSSPGPYTIYGLLFNPIFDNLSPPVNLTTAKGNGFVTATGTCSYPAGTYSVQISAQDAAGNVHSLGYGTVQILAS